MFYLSTYHMVIFVWECCTKHMFDVAAEFFFSEYDVYLNYFFTFFNAAILYFLCFVCFVLMLQLSVRWKIPIGLRALNKNSL